MNGPVHAWFGLSYSNYLVLPRTLMQSMPKEWQQRMVACLDEMQAAFAHVEQAESYKVEAVEEIEYGDADDEPTLVPVPDPVPHYNRGRMYIEPLDPSRADR